MYSKNRWCPFIWLYFYYICERNKNRQVCPFSLCVCVFVYLGAHARQMREKNGAQNCWEHVNCEIALTHIHTLTYNINKIYIKEPYVYSVRWKYRLNEYVCVLLSRSGVPVIHDVMGYFHIYIYIYMRYDIRPYIYNIIYNRIYSIWNIRIAIMRFNILWSDVCRTHLNADVCARVFSVLFCPFASGGKNDNVCSSLFFHILFCLRLFVVLGPYIGVLIYIFFFCFSVLWMTSFVFWVFFLLTPHIILLCSPPTFLPPNIWLSFGSSESGIIIIVILRIYTPIW